MEARQREREHQRWNSTSNKNGIEIFIKTWKIFWIVCAPFVYTFRLKVGAVAVCCSSWFKKKNAFPLHFHLYFVHTKYAARALSQHTLHFAFAHIIFNFSKIQFEIFKVFTLIIFPGILFSTFFSRCDGCYYPLILDAMNFWQYSDWILTKPNDGTNNNGGKTRSSHIPLHQNA